MCKALGCIRFESEGLGDKVLEMQQQSSPVQSKRGRTKLAKSVLTMLVDRGRRLWQPAGRT